mgnify:CR=1 FL=1
MDIRENVEVFKIKSFIDMVADHEYVGVPLTGGWSRSGSGGDINKYDQFEVESWPLVQAYGLAAFGTGGFFTMKHRVLNVTPHLDTLFAHIDAHTLKRLVVDVVPTLQAHWTTAMQVLDVSRSRQRRGRLVEGVVADALITHYEFGRLRSAGAAAPGRGPRVLFGTRTNDQTLSASLEVAAADAGVGGSPALHFTMEAEDPGTGVRVARTYFLRTGFVPVLPSTATQLVDEDGADEDAVEEAAAAVASGVVDRAGGGGGGGVVESKGVDGGEGGAASDAAPAVVASPGAADAAFLRSVYALVQKALTQATAALGACEHLSDAGGACLDAAFEVFAPPETGEPLLPFEFPIGENLEVAVHVMDAAGNAVDPMAATSAKLRLLAYVFYRGWVGGWEVGGGGGEEGGGGGGGGHERARVWWCAIA